MPVNGPKFYKCVLCSRRPKPKERRKVNKEVKKTLTKCFMVTDCTDDSVICNKCSHRCYKIRNDECAPFSKQTTDSVDDPTFHPTAKKPKSNPAASPPSVKLSIPSTNRGHSFCFTCICKKAGSKLVVTPIKARFTVFLHKEVYVPAGSRCCPGHIVDGILTSDALQKIRTSNDSTYLNRTSILELLQNARESLLQKTHTRFDFDDPHGLSDEYYYNLTGLTKTQFDDLMGYVNDVRSSKSRSVRICAVTFVTRQL